MDSTTEAINTAASAAVPATNSAINEGPGSVQLRQIHSSTSLPSSVSEPSVDDGTETWEHDSAIDVMSIASSTTSARSSLYEHIEENGRTYHRYRSGKYMLPNDEQEQSRLDMQHEMLCATFGGRLSLIPFPENFSGEVLDIATGTGIWAVEYATLYPKCHVTGTDLSPIQPNYIPPNCSFLIDDAEDEWVFHKNFDYIHGRALLSCFKDPKEVYQKAFDALNPGGYLELQDGLFPLRYVGDPPIDSAVYKWMNLLVEGAEKGGRPWTNAQYYKQWLEEIGFEDVVEKKFYIPTSKWAKGRYFKQLSVYLQDDLIRASEGMSLKIMGMLGWTVEEIRAFLPDVVRDLRDERIHAYMAVTVVHGRKPSPPNSS